MGEAYRLQSRARKVAASARLPQAQSATVLDEPLESVVQELLRERPAFQEPGQRRPRGFGSRADVYLPREAKIKIQLGDHVVGGETVLAVFE